MTAIVDVRAALITILKADTATAALVGTNVFGDELPRSMTDNIEAGATKAVVVDASGGPVPPYAGGHSTLEAQRVDVFCYGETLFEAEKLRRTVYTALKDVIRTVASGVLVHWCNPAGGASRGRDPDTDWPLNWNSWSVLADERAVV